MGSGYGNGFNSNIWTYDSAGGGGGGSIWNTGEWVVDSGSGVLCDPPPGGPNPIPVPSSGSFSSTVDVKDQSAGFVSSLSILCTETGVTLTSVCGTVRFFLPSSGTFHYTTPGGAGIQCISPNLSFAYPSASQSGFAMTPIHFFLMHS